MEIIRHPHGRPAQQKTETFTGTVWFDPLLPPTDDVAVNNVFFPPSARTHWHSHENGQYLHVVAGTGLVCSEGGEPQPISAGDAVWVPAGERHWHGATSEGFLLHTAVSLGTTSWSDAVTDADYGKG